MRAAAVVVGALDAVIASIIVIAMIASGSDAATKGLDLVAALVIAVLFALTGLPALLLGWRDASPCVALLLALGFPAILIAGVAMVALSLT